MRKIKPTAKRVISVIAKLISLGFWIVYFLMTSFSRLVRRLLHSPSAKKAGHAAKRVHHHVARKPHEHLSRKFSWYRRYHDWRWHHHMHIGVLATYMIVIVTVTASYLQPVLAATSHVWDFTTPADFSIDNALEVNGTSLRHKAQNYTADANTMGLWHLDEANGSTADDSSSNNNDGTISGGTFGAGNLNNGLTLDGVDDSFSVNDSSSLSLTGQNTLEGWIKPDAAISAGSSAQRQSIIDKGDYQLYIDNETGKLTYEMANNAANSWTEVAGSEENNSWDATGKAAAQSVTYIGSDVYVGLGSTTGDAEVWRWNGTTWAKVGGDGVNGSWSDLTYETVSSLETDGTNIYAGLGNTNGGADGEVWRYNGTTWTKLGGDGVNGSMPATTDEVTDLEWFNSKLYAATGNGNADGHVWEWDNGTWTQVGGSGSANSSWNTPLVSSLTSGGGKLYAGTSESVWEWSGSGSWTRIASSSVNSAWGSGYDNIRSLSYFNGKLYAGLGDTNGEAEVWEFNGTNDWTQVGGDSLNSSWGSGYERVQSLGFAGNSLFAGLGISNGDGEIWRYHDDDSNGTWVWVQVADSTASFPTWETGSPDIVTALSEGGSTLYAGTQDADHGGFFGVLSDVSGTDWETIGGRHLNGSWGYNSLSEMEVMYSTGDYLYAGTAGGQGGSATLWRYDGASWSMVGGQGVGDSWAANTFLGVYSITSYSGKLYVGIGNGSGTAEVWEYTGSTWTQIGGANLAGGWDSGLTEASALTWFNGELYAGFGAGSGDNDIYRWSGSGTSWTRVYDGSNRRVNSFAVYKNQLYAGLGSLGDQADIVRYDGGTTWTKIGGDGVNSGWGGNYENVQSMMVFGDKLYVGLGANAGEAEVWGWDGTTWSGGPVGGDGVNDSWVDGTYETVYTMTAYNGQLYAGLGSSTGDAEVWRWNGSGSWTKVAGNTQNGSWDSDLETVESFSVYKGKLYAGLGTNAADGLVWSYGNNAYLQSDASSWDTNWHHVAATYDGTTMRLFIDGTASGSREATIAMPNTDKPLYIGTGFGAREMGKPHARFQGQLDEIRISNTARSSFQATPYSAAQLTISPNTASLTSGVISWAGFSDSATLNGGSINYRLSKDDGATWDYWDGDSWEVSNDLSQVSTASIINTNISDYPVVLGGGIKWQAVAQGNGSQRVTLASVTVSAETDAVDPEANASNVQMYASNGGASISSNAWTNVAAPYFTWTAGTDDDSGIYGYCLYLGQGEGSDPTTSKGLLGTSPAATTGTPCQFIVSGTSVDLSTAGYIATAFTTSSSPYYLYVTAIDNAGNVITDTDVGFQFRFDNTPPANPAYLTAPAQFVATEDITVTWPTAGGDAASDSHSGVAGLQYRIGSGGTWYGDSHSGDQDLSDLLTNDGSYLTDDPLDHAALVDGNNTFYIRTWDTAGNVTTSYITAVLKVNTSSPSSPQNLIATPATNTINSFAFSWSPPATYAGSASNITYCYTVNTLPTSSTCNFTSGGVTSLPSGAFATQPGANTFYVVAKDEAGNINYSTYESATFTANTAAPGIPINADIADISVRQTSNWKLAISWEQPTSVGAGVSTYQLYRSLDGTSYSPSATTSGTSFVDSNLSQVDYYYKIRACDSANNCGAFSSVVTKKPTGKFTTPAGLIGSVKVSNVSTRKATISWVTDRESDSRISIGTTSGDYFPTESANSDQVKVHSIELSNLSAGTTYYLKAKWGDADGNLGLSTELSFSTDEAPTVKEVNTKNINLSLATIQFTSTGASKVKVYYGKSEGFGGIKEQDTSTNESTYSVTLDDLEDGAKYFYKINTFDSDGNEYTGNIFSFSTPARPRISGLRFQPVEGEPTSTQKITWTTNVPSSSSVIYRIINKDAKEQSDSTLTTEHEVIIRGLLDDSEYALTAQSRDATGNLAVSDEQIFKTALDTRPPKLFDVTVEDGIRGTGSEARGQVIVSWKTDEPATSQVAYGEGVGGDTYTTTTVEDSSLVTDHIVIISDLPTSKTYHLKALSRDKSRNQGSSEDNSTIIGRASESVIGIIFNALQKVFSFLQ